MAAGTYNLSIEQGSTWELTLEVDATAGTDLNLDGYSFDAKIAKSHYDENPVSITASIINAAEGKFRLSLSASETTLLDSSFEYLYTVNLVKTSNGKVTRLIQGRATISAGL
jgi:hypothetical protein